jgi:hypothetical protein
VLLLADPGIGKTHLARTFLERHRRTTAALSARAFRLGATESFGVWSQALEDHLRGLSADEVTALCGGYLDDLAPLAPIVTRQWPDAAASGSASWPGSALRRITSRYQRALAFGIRRCVG